MINSYLLNGRLKYLIFLLVLTAALTSIYRVGASAIEYLPDKMACVKLSGQFMRNVIAGNIEEAFTTIEPYFPISQREYKNLLEQTETQLQGSKSSFGEALDYKFVREETVGEFLARYVFVIRHEMTATVWKFLYYKPGEKWLLNSLHWNDNVSRLFSDEQLGEGN